MKSRIGYNACGWGLGIVLLGVTELALSASLDIQARFRPDPTKPSHNVFENLTDPGSSYCGIHPTYCAPGMFSIAVPITFRSTGDILPLHDVRQGPMFQMPAYWKDITVVHDETGETETVRMRVNGIGAAYTIRTPLDEHVWQAPWVYAPEPCQFGGVGYGNAFYYAFFWRVPAGAGVCAKQAQRLIPASQQFSYQDMAFSYEMVTPNPLKMSQGTYRGTTSYSVGPYKDFDMGDVMQPDDDILHFNFTLSVEHTLKVDVPPGGTLIELVPQGGWQAWLNQGRKPTRLFKDQTVNLYASSRFKMLLGCQYAEAENTCRIRDNASGESVPVNVSVSLPYGITDGAGRPVNRQPLRRDGVGTELFQPTFYVDRKPSTLHFEIERDEVEKMLKVGESRAYSGNITVIWDSEV